MMNVLFTPVVLCLASSISATWIWNPDVNENSSPWKVTATPGPISYCGDYNPPSYLCNPFWIIDGTPDAPLGGDRYTAYDYDAMAASQYYFTIDFDTVQNFNIWRFAGSGSCNYGFTTAELQVEANGVWTTITDSSVSGAESDIVDDWSVSSIFETISASKVRVKINAKASCSSNPSSIYQLYAKGFNIGWEGSETIVPTASPTNCSSETLNYAAVTSCLSQQDDTQPYNDYPWRYGCGLACGSTADPYDSCVRPCQTNSIRSLSDCQYTCNHVGYSPSYAQTCEEGCSAYWAVYGICSITPGQCFTGGYSEAPTSAPVPTSPKPTSVPTSAAASPVPTSRPTSVPTSAAVSPVPTLTPYPFESPAPTTQRLTPTPYPTKSPVTSHTTVTFNVTQRLDGITIEEFMLDYDTNAFVFEETIVQIAHLDDITEVVIIDVHEIISVAVSANDDAATNDDAAFYDDAATNDDATNDDDADGNNTSIEIVYETSVLVGEDNDYENSEEAYEGTSDLLESSIESGEFTEVLEGYAVEEGSDALSHASANSLAGIGPYVATTTTDDDNTMSSSSGSNDESMVTGLVVAGVCIIVAISAYLFCKWRKKVHRFKTGKYTWTIRPSIAVSYTHLTLPTICSV